MAEKLPDDERVVNLPAWARKLINETRSIAQHAEEAAAQSSAAAELARSKFNPDDCVITYQGPDGEVYGLPGVTTVNIGDLELTLGSQGLEIDSLHQLVIEPRTNGHMIVRSR